MYKILYGRYLFSYFAPNSLNSSLPQFSSTTWDHQTGGSWGNEMS
jgi:hypothetical protein